MSILAFRHHTDDEKVKIAPITIKKGHYVLFKTGQNNCADCVEVNDLLQGVWLKDGNEVFGVARYDGPDKYDQKSYTLITDFTINQ